MSAAPFDTPRPSVILPVQYLRGLAALMVVWHHSRGQIPALEALIPAGGASGVDLFFTISGFIMVVTTQSSAGPLEFMRRRIVRVVPLYWVMTLLMVAVALAVPSLFRSLVVAPDTLLKSLFFIPHFSNSFPDHVWPLLVPGWTLNYEMFFYAMFALSLLIPERARIGALAAFFVGLVVLGWAAGPFHSAAGRMYTHPIILEFIAGGLIGVAWRRKWIQLPLGVALLFAVVGLWLLLSESLWSWGMSSKIAGSALIVLAALAPKLASWKSRILEAIGNASYSLYLTHLFTLGIIRVIWSKLFPGEPTLFDAGLFMCVAMAGSTLASLVVYEAVEKPLSQAFSRSGRALRLRRP